MRRAFTPYPVNSLALVAAEAALSDRKFLRGYIDDVLRKPLISWREGSSNWARAFSPAAPISCWRTSAPGGTRLVKRLARRGILVRDRASEFGRDGFVRITAGTVAQTQRLLKSDQGGAVKRGEAGAQVGDL